MLRSMTGFGRRTAETSGFVQEWEIRSVNGRHLDVKWRLPSAVRGMEARLERVVRSFALRGRVDIGLILKDAGESADRRFDAERAGAMLDAVRDLAAARGERFVPDCNILLQIPSLWAEADDAAGDEILPDLERGLELALADWNDARAREGRILGADLRERVLRMRGWMETVAAHAPEIREERVAALRGRVSEALAQAGQDLDENRFLQEIVLLADKLDVSEELTRLAAHLDRMLELLDDGADAGRRLDFTLQECFREINTCGNKIPDVRLSRIVVDFKNELEKCREQVQNLE